MKPTRIEHNWLPDNFYSMPRYANTILTTKELRETVLATNGAIIAAGYLWDIKNIRVAPGAYRVWLVRRD